MSSTSTLKPFLLLFFNVKLPSNFQGYFSKNEELHSYNTWSGSKVHVDYYFNTVQKSTNMEQFTSWINLMYLEVKVLCEIMPDCKSS